MSNTKPAVPNPGSGRQIAGRSNALLIVAAAVAMILVIAVVFTAAATRVGEGGPPLRIIDVPGDHPTIQAAVDAAEPGDIVRVAPGTYQENLLLNKPITLTARFFNEVNPVGNTTILDGGSGGPTIVVPSGMSQMPVVRGLVIRAGSSGVQAGSDLVLEFNYLLNASVLADYQSGAGGVNQGNVYFGSGDDAIRVASPASLLRIENNRIMYSGGSAIRIGLTGGSPDVDSQAIEISNNMIVGSGRDGIAFVDAGSGPEDRSDRFVVSRNLIARNARAGIAIVSPGGERETIVPADADERVHAYNNTIFENSYGLVGGDNLVAINSIFMGQSLSAAAQVQGEAGADSTIAYSLFFGNKVDFEESAIGVGNIRGPDPLFVAPPNPGSDGIWETVDDDFSGLLLQANSPAIDRGVVQFTASSGDLVPGMPISDFVGAAPDLGWREYGSPLFMTATPTASPSPTPVITGTLPSPTSTSTISPTQTLPSGTGTVISPTAPAATSTPGATATGQASPTAEGIDIEIIVPTSATAGSTLNMTVSGAGFQGGATVMLEGGLGTAPLITNVVVLDSSTLVVTLQTSGPLSTPTIWDLRVTNPDGTYAILEDAFTLMP